MTLDPLQIDLQDHDLLDEVELTAALMAAANRSDSALSLDEIDELLGLGARGWTPPTQASPGDRT